MKLALKVLNSNQIFLRSEKEKLNEKENITQKFIRKKEIIKNISLLEPAKNENLNEEIISTSFSNRLLENNKIQDSNIFFESSIQSSQRSHNFDFENKNLSELLEKKIFELIEKNKLLEQEFNLVLKEKNHLKIENIQLSDKFHELDNKNRIFEEKNSKKIGKYKEKIKDLETELMESHESIIDLEKKFKVFCIKH